MSSDPIARYLATRGNLMDRQVYLRARPTGELLDETFRVYRRHGFLLLRLTAVPAFFVFAAIVFLASYVIPALATASSTNLSDQVLETAFNFLVALFVAAPLAVFGTSYVCAVVTSLISQVLIGGVADVEEALRVAKASIPTLLKNLFRTLLLSVSGVALASGLMLVGGLVASVTPETSAMAGLVTAIGMIGLTGGGFLFLWVIAMHAMVPAVTVLEGAKGAAASRRSVQLFRGTTRHPHGAEMIWSLGLLLGLIALALAGGTYSIPNLFGLAEHLDGWLGNGPSKQIVLESFLYLPAYCVVWLLLPTWATGTTLLYYDRRIRLEGYDIDLLAEEVNRTQQRGRFRA